MPAATHARVTSIEVLDDFRAKLLVYIARANRILDDVNDDVARTRVWLQTDRLMYWKRQVREKEKALAIADQELMTARLSDTKEALQARRMAVNKCKAALQVTEARLAKVKHWIRHYATAVEPKTKAVVQLRHVLDADMRKAVAFLEQAAAALADYAEVSPTTPPPASAKDTPPPAVSNGGEA